VHAQLSRLQAYSPYTISDHLDERTVEWWSNRRGKTGAHEPKPLNRLVVFAILLCGVFAFVANNDIWSAWIWWAPLIGLCVLGIAWNAIAWNRARIQRPPRYDAPSDSPPTSRWRWVLLLIVASNITRMLRAADTFMLWLIVALIVAGVGIYYLRSRES
jgi:predicted permease